MTGYMGTGRRVQGRFLAKPLRNSAREGFCTGVYPVKPGPLSVGSRLDTLTHPTPFPTAHLHR